MAWRPAKITKIALQSGSDRTVYVEWDCPNVDNINHYEVRWWYRIKLNDGTTTGIQVDNDTSTTQKRTVYNAPSEALWVTCYVKPISKTRKVNNKDTVYWTADWSDPKSYYFEKDAPTGAPSEPSVSIEDLKLTATVDNLDPEITHVEFQIAKDNKTEDYKRKKVAVTLNHASWEVSIASGGTYKVRCRYYNRYGVSEWSAWTSNEDTPPQKPSGFTVCKAKTETSVWLEWKSVSGATSYDIEYTTEKRYFDTADDTTILSGIESCKREITGLDSGDQYFFRLRSVNDAGHSAWSGIKSVTIGTIPIEPTTWSSTTTVIVGEPVTLHWIHNSEDESAQTGAQVEITVKRSDTDPGTTSTYTMNTEDEDDDEKTMYYTLPTSGYPEGAIIQWRVRTAGALIKQYGEWSIQRTVDVYARPSLSIILANVFDIEIDTLDAFPFKIIGEASPSTQTPTGYHITVRSNSYYETSDFLGNTKVVREGDIVYSKYINASSDLELLLSAGDIDLENGVSYIITCVVSMNSGLSAEDSKEFTVSWIDEEYLPNAELSVDRTDVTVSLRPYARTTDGEDATDVTMSVYRREFDGTFVELTKGLDPTKGTYITDPHPALDYARYRIVAISNVTGSVSYYDLPPYPVNEKSVIIQWDEVWSDFEYTEGPRVEPVYSGSILKLPYNIDVSEDYSPDLSLVKYIGRSHPVSYYGTQQGVSASWSVMIPKTDVETIYALRRLAIWPGDVYVREPSGTGYWANVTVSFSQKHLDTTIPVKLNVTRVSGGV